jgi:hypothetical protein
LWTSFFLHNLLQKVEKGLTKKVLNSIIKNIAESATTGMPEMYRVFFQDI